jgi:hypothetical protein
MAHFEWCSLVPFVLGLFTFGYVSFMYVVLYSWLGFDSFWGRLNALILHACLGLVYFNYIAACLSDPGVVSAEGQSTDNGKEKIHSDRSMW